MRLLSIGFLLCTTFSFGQSTSNHQDDLNRVIVRHFNPTHWEYIGNFAPDMYTAINYYFKESFEIEMSNCNECEVDYNTLFNRDLFDVYAYESQRLDDSDFTFDFKEYRITLLPKNIVYPQLQGLLPTELVKYIAPRDFPMFELTNNDYAHFLEYTEKVDAWAKDFPEQYRAMTNSESLLKISIKEFSELPEEKKISFLSHSTGYLIIN